MRLLLASSEVHPYSKTGGLADMAGALGKFLGRAGHQVGIVTPLYRGVQARFPAMKKMDWWMDLPLGASRVQAEVWTLAPSEGVTVYFISQPAFFDRPALYDENGWAYEDNPQRFIFLSKAVVHLARYLPWQPELVHVHDWQTGIVPLLILHQKAREGWSNAPKSVFTIHNIAYQGNCHEALYAYTNLPRDYFQENGAEFFGQLSPLKAGILFADLITTVSPRHAREITTSSLGFGLDGALRSRQSSLVGILNGVDYEEWNTLKNQHLKHGYSPRSLAGKRANKMALQQEFGLPVRPDVPLFANVSRLAYQKGMDILLGSLEEMVSADLQFVSLGSGDTQYARAFEGLAQRFPEKASVRIGFDAALSHRVEAGSDFFLMPSRFEPCGLNQMYSLRYGTIPIVRVTGGLDDSVIDINEDVALVNGIKFEEYSTRALSKAIRKALMIFHNRKLLRLYRINGMKANFSWGRTSQHYLDLYRKILAKPS